MPHTSTGILEQVGVPYETGFSALVCSVVVLRPIRQARLSIVGHRVRTNLGPGLHIQRMIPWSQGMPIATLRSAVRAFLQEAAEDLSSGRLLSRDVFLDACNASGVETSDFMSKTCILCKCPYCEIASV